MPGLNDRRVNNDALQQTMSVKLNQNGQSHVPAVCSIGPISCYVNDGDNWHKTDFGPDKFKVSLSQLITGGQKSLGVKSDIEALRYDHFWLVFPKEFNDELNFNWFQNHNSILTKNSATFLKAGKRRVLVTTKRTETVENEEIKAGLPEMGEYGIESVNGEFKYPCYKTLLLGSNPICDVKMEAKPFAAMIFAFKNELYIGSLGSDTVSINDVRMNEPYSALAHNDVVSINETAISIKLSGMPFDPICNQLPDATLCLLDISSTDQAMEKIFLPPNKAVTFGRGSVSDIVIDDKSISRKHAQLIIYEDHVQILDCYSKNGTFVNDNKVGKSRSRPGDLITFANKSYILCHYNG